MALLLTLTYASGADLRAYLLEQVNHGAVLVPVEGDLSAVIQFDEARLDIRVGETRGQLGGQVLQVLPGRGIVLQLADPGDLALLAESADHAAPSQAPYKPPSVEIAALAAVRALDALAGEEPSLPWDETPAGEAQESEAQESEARESEAQGGEAQGGEAQGGEAPENEPQEGEAQGGEARGGEAAGGPVTREPFIPAGSSPVSWSIELLQARWDSLTLAERIRVARYGNRPARGLVMRGVDRSLHIHLLQNPGLSLEEVTIMAGMANLDQVTLQRIATSIDWQKQASVARALLTNPKIPQTFVPRLVKNVPRDELSRLARTGKVRANIKEFIVKHLDRTR